MYTCARIIGYHVVDGSGNRFYVKPCCIEEAEIAEILSGANIAPRTSSNVDDLKLQWGSAIISLPKLSYVMSEYVGDHNLYTVCKVDLVVKTMDMIFNAYMELGFMQDDPHFGNFMIRNGEIFFIDFGIAHIDKTPTYEKARRYMEDVKHIFSHNAKGFEFVVTAVKEWKMK